MSSEITPEIVEKIRQISSHLANKYVFPNYDREDIEQEAFIIGLEAMSRYDASRPLENFLRVHMKNRLSNLRRDKYYRPDTGKAEQIQKGKKKLLDACPFDELSNVFAMMDASTLDSKELLEYIAANLDAIYRADYLRFIDGQKLTKVKRSKLFEQLKRIMVKYYEDGSTLY